MTAPLTPFKACPAPRHGAGANGCLCLLDAAQDYARGGFAVFPLHGTDGSGNCSCNQTAQGMGPCRQKNPSPGKHPRTEHGLNDATTDLDTIRGWWTRWPDANIGVATGAPSGGQWLVDVDGATGYSSLGALEADHTQLPPTLTVTTGRADGGEHRWFTGGHQIRNSTSKIGPGIDVRGTGGYGILPPSLHPSGSRYRWADGSGFGQRGVAGPPEWVVAAATAPTRPATQPSQTPTPQHDQRQTDVMDWLLGGSGQGGTDAERLTGIVTAACSRIRSAPEGTRNDTVNRTCFAIGGWLDGLGGTVDGVSEALESAAAEAGQPASMVRRSLEDGRRHPRGRPPDRPPNREDVTQLAPPSWVLALRAAAESSDAAAADALYASPDLLVGLVRPGKHAGEVERLLRKLPYAVRTSLRRAGRELLAASRVGRRTPAHALELPLIVQYGPSWWLRDGDRYLCVARELAAIEVSRLNPDTDTTVLTETSTRRMTPGEVYDAHGVTARKIRWTYGAAGASWDPATRILTMPGARVCDGAARRSEVVESWLHVLVPREQLGKLLDWLATAVILDRPTASAQLRGVDSAGKALIAAALTTLLGGRSDYRHATGEFNGVLIWGPLVLLDEGVAESQPDQFRQITGSREHQVMEKGRMPEVLIGCPRVLVTSNEADPVKLGREELSSHSEHALGRRILVFDVQQAAADRLAEIGGWEATGSWADPDGELVCHLRWLAANRRVVHGNRFLVEGDAGEWLAGAHTRAGVAGDVVQAYAAYKDLEHDSETGSLDEPGPFHYSDDHPEHVGVSVSGLQANWKRLVGDAKVPSHQRISAALRRMSGQEIPVRPRTSDKRAPRVYFVEKTKLKDADTG